jgi:hypothetical protein
MRRLLVARVELSQWSTKAGGEGNRTAPSYVLLEFVCVGQNLIAILYGLIFLQAGQEFPHVHGLQIRPGRLHRGLLLQYLSEL